MNLSIVIHRIYHWCRYALSAKNIHHIHSPFLFEFVRDCLNPHNHYYCFNDLKKIKSELSNDKTLIPYQNIGAASFSLKKNIRIKDVVKTAVSPSKYSELYFRICLFLKAENVLELGTSVGLNAMCLSYAAKKVISIEGQPALCGFAKELLKKHHIQNCEIVCSDFDTALQTETTNKLFSVVFIDGNHTYEATIRYYNQLKNRLTPVAAIVIDDIYWNKEMTKAWDEIVHSPGIKITLDLYRCGIVLFNNNFIQSQHFTLWY